MTAEEVRKTTLEDKYLNAVAELILHNSPSSKFEVQEELQPYWSFRDEIVVIDGIAIKGKRITVPASIQDKTLKQLHINHIGIVKLQMLACESMYLVNMNASIEKTIKTALHVLIPSKST